MAMVISDFSRVAYQLQEYASRYFYACEITFVQDPRYADMICRFRKIDGNKYPLDIEIPHIYMNLNDPLSMLQYIIHEYGNFNIDKSIEVMKKALKK